MGEPKADNDCSPRSYLELALDGQVGGEVRDSLSRSYAASKSLVLVINDLLDLTRTSASNELHLEEPLNLLQLLDEAMSIHKAEAQRRGLTFEVTESPSGTPLTVLGDKAQLKRVLSNLIANAVAYTREGGISITWGEIEDEGDLESVRVSKMHGLRLGVSVRDTGSDLGVGTIFDCRRLTCSAQHRNVVRATRSHLSRHRRGRQAGIDERNRRRRTDAWSRTRPRCCRASDTQSRRPASYRIGAWPWDNSDRHFPASTARLKLCHVERRLRHLVSRLGYATSGVCASSSTRSGQARECRLSLRN